MFIASSTIICLHYATNYENLWPYRIGVAQTQIQPSPLTHKAPSRPQSYSHLLHILAHQCLLFLTPITPICLIMQILLTNLSLNIILLFSHTYFTPSVHHHTSWCRKFSSCTPSLHRAIAKNTIFCLQTILHSSHVMCATPKSSHSFGTHEPSLLLGTIFLRQFVGLSSVILKFLLWISLYSVHEI